MTLFERLFSRLSVQVPPSSVIPANEAYGIATGDHSRIELHHQSRFPAASVYFVWTQATAKPINLGKAVQRLLKAEVATSAAWPSEERVRLAPSIAKLDRALVKLREMQSFADDAHDVPSMLKASVRDPRTAIRLLATARAASLAGENAAPAGASRAESSLEETLAEIEGLLMDMQKVSIAERSLDSNLFGGEAQFEDHYVRLMLRSTHHEIDLTGTEHRVTIEPRLLLHQDGAMQLTLGVHLPPGLETSELIDAAYPSLEFIVRSHIPEPYAGENGRWVGGDWDPEPDGGVRVRSLEHDGSASMFDHMQFVSTQVLRLIRARAYGEWHCYPIIMAQAGDCCTDWEGHHKHDLSRLSARSLQKRSEQFQYPLGENFSVQSDHSYYVGLGSALVVYWRQWSPGIRDLDFTLLLEHTLLVYTRMRRLERNIRAFRTRRRGVRKMYRTALQLAQEARGASIRWGTGRTISRHLLTELGADEIRRTVDQGLSMTGELAAVRTSERSARAANRLAFIGVLIALIAAVPAIPTILNLIEEQRRTNNDTTVWSIVQTLATSPMLLSTLVLAAIVLYFLVGAAVIAGRVVRYLLSIRKQGYASRLTGYRVTVGDERDHNPE